MNIAAQVDRLVESHAALVRACSELTAERDSLRDQNRMLAMKVRELQSRIARLQLSESLSGGGADKEQARARINRLLREVDRCIALIDKSADTNDEEEQENG